MPKTSEPTTAFALAKQLEETQQELARVRESARVLSEIVRLQTENAGSTLRVALKIRETDGEIPFGRSGMSGHARAMWDNAVFHRSVAADACRDAGIPIPKYDDRSAEEVYGG